MIGERAMGDGRCKVACVQHCAGLDVEANLRELASLIEQAVADGAALVCLPEYCAAYGMTDGRLDVGARPEHEHEALRTLIEQARRRRCWLLIGSIGVLADDGRILNRSYLLDPEGRSGPATTRFICSTSTSRAVNPTARAARSGRARPQSRSPRRSGALA
jgi:predicted amidohydrolase